MKTMTVSLTFLGPVHFGQGRLSDSGYTCDAATLFSALFIEALHEGSQRELLDAVRSGELLLSDAFPYIGESLYLPKPMLAPDVFDSRNMEREALGAKRDSRERKADKKLSYIPVNRYASYLAGDLDPIAELERFDLGKSSLQTKVNLTREEDDDAKPYFVGGFSFAPQAGLYFLVQGSYDLIPLLEQLSFAGLGGKRTSGYGRFKFRVEDVDPLAMAIQSAKNPTTSVLLATSTPRAEELDDNLLEGARYRLVRKGGFVQSQSYSATPRKKRDMYSFAAGSTFARRFEGDIFDVSALPGSHPVYRYSKAMWMEV